MPLAESLPCADLGTAYCPCSLAFAGACVYCTRLRLEERCACDWAGACALLQAGGRSHEVRNTVPELRRTHSSRVLAARDLAPGVREIRFSVDPGAAGAFRRPGAFLLARMMGFPAHYDLPLTVPWPDPGQIRLVFKVAGPKTRALAAAEAGDLVMWRGPYYSGLHGGSRLIRRRPDHAVVVARGLGQVMASQVVSWLHTCGVATTALVDPGGTGGAFALGELSRAGRAALIESRDPRGVETIGAVLCSLAASGGGAMGRSSGAAGVAPVRAGDAPASPAAGAGSRVALVSCGSDLQHRWLAKSWPRFCRVAAGRMILEIAATNNSLVVCGEGVCGACVRRFPRGERFRACKADPPAELLWPPAKAGKRAAAAPASAATVGRAGNG